MQTKNQLEKLIVLEKIWTAFVGRKCVFGLRQPGCSLLHNVTDGLYPTYLPITKRFARTNPSSNDTADVRQDKLKETRPCLPRDRIVL